jgi:hypothetical protein
MLIQMTNDQNLQSSKKKRMSLKCYHGGDFENKQGTKLGGREKN